MTHYPPNTVRDLLKTDQVTDATRQVLTERLDAPSHPPTFFTVQECDLLQAICRRLIPQDDHTELIDIAGNIDERLSQQKSDGWRYDVMPADGDAYKLGLKAIEAYQPNSRIFFLEPFKRMRHRARSGNNFPPTAFLRNY